MYLTLLAEPTWTKQYGVRDVERKAQDAQSDEMRRLKAELKRITDERDILKKAAVYFAKPSGYVTDGSMPYSCTIKIVATPRKMAAPSRLNA